MKYVEDADFTLHQGDVLACLAELPDESVHCVVTSPPYWGLRDYGTGSWDGGNPDCDHKNTNWDRSLLNDGASRDRTTPIKDECHKCGARRVDQQLGLEPTPEEYVARMVDVFREVRRVLRADGTLWLNLGDSYVSQGGERRYGSHDGAVGRGDAPGKRISPTAGSRRTSRDEGSRPASPLLSSELAIGHPDGSASALKSKDLVGIPWRVAFALQQPYYTGRIAAERDRVWLAAILDGEGTICGMRHERPDGNIRTGCMVFITNTSEPLLDECDRIWKGARYSEKVTSEVARPCWRWELQAAEDRSALVRELYPYLIEKKRQALVAWNLLEIVQAAKKLGRGGESEETKAKRALLVRTLSDLNQRRPVDLPSWLREPPGLHEPGWYLRSDVIWSKNNPMPESVTDRPTKAHEYVFLLSKSPRYYFDQEAVREKYQDPREGGDGFRWHSERYTNQTPAQSNHVPTGRGPDGRRKTGVQGADGSIQHRDGERWPNPSGRNVRSVWEIATQPYPEAHFATYPEELVRRCILAGSSERGCCPVCGKPWEREVERESAYEGARRHDSLEKRGLSQGTGWKGGADAMPKITTLGWRPGCDCAEDVMAGSTYAPIPCTVLDPFMGSGTTAYVARNHGRRSVGIELNPDYCALAARRLQQQSLFA